MYFVYHAAIVKCYIYLYKGIVTKLYPAFFQWVTMLARWIRPDVLSDRKDKQSSIEILFTAHNNNNMIQRGLGG